jgi:hypothetical protein
LYERRPVELTASGKAGRYVRPIATPFLNRDRPGVLMIFILTFAGGLLMYALIHASVKAPGHSLARKFASAGTLAGKTRSEIVALVGPPNSISGLPNGKTLCQWMAPGYHIALRFNGDVCEGVTHEVKV